jgi:hypothetical protein
MRRWIVPAVPFVFSLSLTLSTVGNHPHWQDSGVYLTAVKELGVLHPPGFCLYLVLCRLWTVALFFVDFALAVHLFSSLRATLAAFYLGEIARKRGDEAGARRLFQEALATPGLSDAYRAEVEKRLK